MRVFRLSTNVLTLLVLVGQTAHVLADDNEPPKKITLFQTEPVVPALKYTLLPSPLDQIDGNAAVYYGKVKFEETIFFSKKELWDDIYRWQTAPLSELLSEQARVPSAGNIDVSLDLGARCRYCDWQIPIGDSHLFTILLPEVQECRKFSRILAADARIDIAHKRYEDAIWRFRTAYALGRHTAETDFIVSGLVGIRICEMTNAQVMEFIQQPGSPNLYWALTALPNPLIDLRNAVELESYVQELLYPELSNREGIGLRAFDDREQLHPELWQYPPARRTPEKWKALYHAIAADMHSLMKDGDEQQLSESSVEEECEAVFPHATDFLIERGMDSEAVEAMSVHQAVLVYMLAISRELIDEMAKYYYLPYPTAMVGFDSVTERMEVEIANVPEEITDINHILTVIKSVKEFETRLAREIAVLRLLEAFRLHGALNGMELPEELSAVTVVPIPDDPVTGQPFEYHLEGDTAFLEGPPLRGVPLRYEISMASQ